MWLIATKAGHCGSCDTPHGLHMARSSLPTHGCQGSEEAFSIELRVVDMNVVGQLCSARLARSA